MTEISPEILFERRGTAGLVTLNRPAALNAVTLGMVRAFTRQLKEWRDDPSVTRIVLTAAGGRAFSAGGDIRALYDAGASGRHAEMLSFYGEEYVLNTKIKHFPKPNVALIAPNFVPIVSTGMLNIRTARVVAISATKGLGIR